MCKHRYKTYDFANSEDTGHITANMKDFPTLEWMFYVRAASFHAANKVF